MAEPKKRRGRRQMEDPAPAAKAEESPAPESKPKTKKAAPQAADHVPAITASMWLGPGGSPISKAFLTVDKMENGIRKLSADEWQRIWDGFISQSR